MIDRAPVVQSFANMYGDGTIFVEPVPRQDFAPDEVWLCARSTDGRNAIAVRALLSQVQGRAICLQGVGHRPPHG